MKFSMLGLSIYSLINFFPISTVNADTRDAETKYQKDIKEAGESFDLQLQKYSKNIAEQTKLIAEKTQTIEQFENDLAQANGAYQKAKNTVEAVDKTISDLETLSNPKDGRTFPEAVVSVVKKELETAKKSRDVAMAEQKQMEAKVQKLNVDIAKLGQDNANLKRGLAQNKEGQRITEAAQQQAQQNMKNDIDNLTAELKKAHVTQRMEELNSKIENAELKQAILENTYNDGLVGKFVKAKLEGLLRDNAFCDAAKACSEGKKSTANLDRLFTSTERDRKKENEAHTERGPR